LGARGPRSGRLTITSASPATGIEYDLAFEEGRYSSDGAIRFRRQGGATTVVWSDRGDLGGGPVSGYVGLLMDGRVGAMFADGLQNSKARVESTPTGSATEAATSQEAGDGR
jgi:hypothetical protein